MSDDADAVEAGVPPAVLEKAVDMAATAEFSAGNLCNPCKSVAE